MRYIPDYSMYRNPLSIVLHQHSLFLFTLLYIFFYLWHISPFNILRYLLIYCASVEVFIFSFRDYNDSKGSSLCLNHWDMHNS